MLQEDVVLREVVSTVNIPKSKASGKSPVRALKDIKLKEP